jgi:hypothetical protein
VSASQGHVLDSNAGSTHKRLRALAEYLHALPCGSRLSISMAHQAVDLCFGDEDLRPLIGRAVEHLKAQKNALPSIQIALHTFASAPNAPEYLLPFSGAPANDIFVIDEDDWTFIVQQMGNIVSAIDWKNSRGYGVASDVKNVPYMERAAPRRNLLSLWLDERGTILTHGAAVGIGAEGVLIVGGGGSGKSTTSILSMLAGLSYASDDHCLISLSPVPMAHSMYCTAKLSAADVEQIPALWTIPSLDGRPPDEKVVFLLNGVQRIHMNPSFRIRALFLAQITGRRDTNLKRIAEMETFRCLVASCTLHLPAQRASALRHFSRLSRSVPGYVLELGTDLDRIPEVIQQYLHKDF